MKNLQEIKNAYAIEVGYEDWDELRYWRDISVVVDGYMNEICIRAQKLALEKASENAEIDFVFVPFDDYRAIVNKETITNPENLIR